MRASDGGHLRGLRRGGPVRQGSEPIKAAVEKNKDIFRFFKSMIAVRKAHPSLGSFSLVLASNFLVRIAFVNALPAFPETASASATYGTCIYKCGLSPADASHCVSRCCATVVE
jgi:hypothetical protein